MNEGKTTLYSIIVFYFSISRKEALMNIHRYKCITYNKISQDQQGPALGREKGTLTTEERKQDIEERREP